MPKHITTKFLGSDLSGKAPGQNVTFGPVNPESHDNIVKAGGRRMPRPERAIVHIGRR